MKKSLTKQRPLLDLRTPLRLIPRIWLELIEPRILRPEDTSCWLWEGAVDSAGEPVVNILNPETGKRGTRRVKKIVGDMFWNLKEYHNIVHECGVINCLNPQHFYVTSQHWTQEDRATLIKRRGDRIRRWGRERNQ